MPLLVGFFVDPQSRGRSDLRAVFGSGTTPAILTAMVICVFPIVVNI